LGFIFGPLVRFGFGCLLYVTELVFFESEMAGKRKRNASSQKLKEDVNRGKSSVNTEIKDVNGGKTPGSKKKVSVSDAKPCDNKDET